MNNGYIVKVGNKIFGPYISFGEADAAHKGSGDRSIQILSGDDFTVKVKDCGRSECNHCRSIKRESRRVS
jgi:hypothetical protein